MDTHLSRDDYLKTRRQVIESQSTFKTRRQGLFLWPAQQYSIIVENHVTVKEHICFHLVHRTHQRPSEKFSNT